MTGFPHIVVEAVAFAVMTATALVGLAYALKNWRDEVRRVDIAAWRRVAATFGLLAVAAQAALFAAIWVRPEIDRDYALLGQWSRWVGRTFLVAVPCVFAGKGASRWWLLSSSVLLFVICFFIALTP
jgi:hypothetical protein